MLFFNTIDCHLGKGCFLTQKTLPSLAEIQGALLGFLQVSPLACVSKKFEVPV